MSEAAALPGAILFVCGQNAIRSPLAERLAKNRLGMASFIQSAGVIAGERDPFVDVVLTEIGIDPGQHKVRAIEDLDDDFYDLVITLSPTAYEEAKRLWAANDVEIEFWPVTDPSETGGKRDQMMDAYRAVRDDIDRRIAERFGR